MTDATTLDEPPAAPAADTGSGRGRWQLWQLALVTGFGLVLAVTMWRHEMWRDELQAWMIVRDSPSLSSLTDHLRYEGHPFLWYAALWPLARSASTPWPMQALQWFIAVGIVALVAWRAPYTRTQKLLFALGYFTVFEFGVLSRAYALGFLYIALVCAIAATRHRWPLCGVLLALLALTSAFSALLSVALLLGLLTDEFMRRRAGEPRQAGHALRFATGSAVATAGVIAAYLQSAPPRDSGVYNSWKTDLDIELANTSAAALWRALVPIPEFTRQFWNTNILDGTTVLGAVVGVAATLLIAWLLRHRPAAAMVWLVGSASTVVFLYSKIRYASSSRHYGHIFLALVAATWLAPAMWRRGPAEPEDRAAAARSRAWTVVLALHVVAGLFAVGLDLALPFSNGEQAAAFLRSEGLADEFIVGIPDTQASVIAAYLDRGIYYPAGGRVGTYILWDEQRIGPLQPLREGLRRLRVGNRPVLLITNEPDPDDRGFRLELLARFDDAIVADEHFWIFRVHLPDRR